MAYLKENAVAASTEKLKNTVENEKLENDSHSDRLSGSDDSEDNSKMLKTASTAVFIASGIGHRSSTRKISRFNKETADDVLLGTREEKTFDISKGKGGPDKLKSEGDGKLYTASARRERLEALREGRTEELVGGLDKTNAAKLRDNRKKLQSKLRQNYEVKTHVSGGMTNDLRIEQTVKSRLHDGPIRKTGEFAGSIGQSALHFTDNALSDGDSTNNAWVDAASKTADGASGVYKVSQTFKHWKQEKNEAEIAKLARQEDKILKNGYKIKYKSALKDMKETDLWKKLSPKEKSMQKKSIKRKYMKNAISEHQKALQAGSRGKITYTTGLSTADKIKSSVSSFGNKVVNTVKSPKTIAVLGCAAVGGAAVSLIGGAGSIFMTIFGGDGDGTQQVVADGFPETVEKWRPTVTKRLTMYGYQDYVNAILATIEQESGGISESCGGDIMQDKASGCWETDLPDDWSSLSEEEKSIDAGCRYFIMGLQQWGDNPPDDYEGLEVVAQGYNYGYDFYDYMLSSGSTAWSEEVSAGYSEMKAEELGLASYGNVNYGAEWLEKYQSGGTAGTGTTVVEEGASGVVRTAQAQLGKTENPPGSNNVIYNTDYYGSEVSGNDYPWCCTFVWWCFNNSGNANAFCNGEKVSGCAEVHAWAQKDRRIINGSQAEYGDLAIFGQDEHIEIIIKNYGDGSFCTIGGNTSQGDGGSQSNGGGVYMRTRYVKGDFPITLFIRPEY